MQATQQGTVVPVEIQQIAGTYKMGAVCKEYGPNTQRAKDKSKGGWSMLIFGLVMVVLGIIAIASAATGSVFLLGGLGFVITGIVYFTQSSSIHSNNVNVYLYEHGFVYSTANQAAQPFRWDQITHVRRNIIHRYRNGVPTGSTHDYSVRRKDGCEIGLHSNNIADMNKLGNTISEETTRILLPLAVESYNQGQAVVFGSFVVDKQGLKWGQELIPWQHIEAIDTQNGMLRLKRQGTWKPSLPCPQIPNLFVFLSLTDSILKTQAQR